MKSRFKQPKLERIYRKLYQAKDEGIIEIDLLNDDESSKYAKVIRSKMNKRLGAGSVYKEDGKWKLHKNLFEFEPIQFSNLIITNELQKTRKVIFRTMFVVLSMMLLIGILLGAFIEIEFIYG